MLISAVITSSCFTNEVLRDSGAHRALQELLSSLENNLLLLYWGNKGEPQLSLRKIHENVEQLEKRFKDDVGRLYDHFLGRWRRFALCRFDDPLPDLSEVEAATIVAQEMKADVVICSNEIEKTQLTNNLSAESETSVLLLSEYLGSQINNKKNTYSRDQLLSEEEDPTLFLSPTLKYWNELAIVDKYFLGDVLRMRKDEESGKGSNVLTLIDHRTASYLYLIRACYYASVGKKRKIKFTLITELPRNSTEEVASDVCSELFFRLWELNKSQPLSTYMSTEVQIIFKETTGEKLFLERLYFVGNRAWKIEHDWQDFRRLSWTLAQRRERRNVAVSIFADSPRSRQLMGRILGLNDAKKDAINFSAGN